MGIYLSKDIFSAHPAEDHSPAVRDSSYPVGALPLTVGAVSPAGSVMRYRLPLASTAPLRAEIRPPSETLKGYPI